jgi:TolB-like protein/DNA-binding winged helix-turn-helix (wHTH) protein
MQDASSSFPSGIRFGVFDVDPRALELRKKGARVKLQQQPFELLMVLLEHPGQVVTREELRQKLWAADVYVDFDRSLNKAMVKLREALGDSSDSPLYIETLPRVGYRFIGPMIAAAQETAEAPTPPASVAAPEPGSKETGIAPSRTVALASSKPENHSRTVLAVGIVALLTAGIAGAWYREHRASSASPIRSIAVLPLDNLSGDSNQDYFADGMTDELTTMLAKDSSLLVTSRTSAMQFKGAHQPLRDIAGKLGVDGILEGSVSRSGDNVHMTIQLIRASDDAHVWAESYDRKANEVATLPSEAATTIAKKLNRPPAKPATPRYARPEAHDSYLRGLYLLAKGDREAGVNSLEKATRIQPDYALAWVGLANYYGNAVDQEFMSPADGLPKLDEAAKKAVELDDSLPEAHFVRAIAYYAVDWDWARSDQELLRAIDLNPRYSEAVHFRSYPLFVQNRNDEAIEAQKQATEIDPFRRSHAMAHAYAIARRFDEAAADAKLRIDSNPDDDQNHMTLSYVYRCQGKYKESVDELATTWVLWHMTDAAADLRNAFRRDGYKGALEFQLALREKRAKTHYTSPTVTAILTAQLGEPARERTLSLLEEALRQRDSQLPLLQTDPAFDFLHADERYRAVVRGVGIPPAY